MTTKYDRYRAIQQCRKLLEDLCDSGKTPRVPSVIRDRARGALRHYPDDYDIERMADSCPELLDRREATLYKLS